MATNPLFGEEAAGYLTGWDCLSSTLEYTYDLWDYTKPIKGRWGRYTAMTRAEVESHITSGEITVSDLNDRFWTRTKSETDKDRCIKALAALFSETSCSVYSIGAVLDKYWPGENKCG